MLPDLERHVERWRPDIIVRETAEFAGCLVAERRELPHASIATGSWSSLDDRREVVADVLDGWRERIGMEPDPSAQMMYRYLHLALTPPRWDGDAVASADGPFHPLRQPAIAPGVASRVARRAAGSALVLASLGTVAHAEAGVFEAILEAVRGEPIEVVAAIGRDQDPARFGEPPANVRIEGYVPQIAVLEQAAAFITHGGFNSTKEALSLGIPLVVIPISGDQPYTAERVEALGLGRRVGPHERSPKIIRSDCATSWPIRPIGPLRVSLPTRWPPFPAWLTPSAC